MMELQEYQEKLEKKSDEDNKVIKMDDEIRDKRQKFKEEIEENEQENIKVKGQNVVYGQEIQFRHIYSNCLLRLNPQKLSSENGCIEVTPIYFKKAIKLIAESGRGRQ